MIDSFFGYVYVFKRVSWIGLDWSICRREVGGGGGGRLLVLRYSI